MSLQINGKRRTDCADRLIPLRQYVDDTQWKFHFVKRIKAEDIPPVFFKLFGLSPNSGALITEVKAGSPAFDAGLSQGDIVLKANKQFIHSANELVAIIAHLKPHDVEILYVKRGLDQNLFIPLKAGG